MPIPPQSDEVCERAWELYATCTGWRDVARKLSAEGHGCSYETARQWGHRGKKLYTTKKDLDPNLQRYRSSDFLEQWMGRLTELAADAELKDVLEILSQMKWMYEARARLLGVNFRPQDALKGEPVEPQPFIQDMVRRAAPAPEELFGDPNGHR